MKAALRWGKRARECFLTTRIETVHCRSQSRLTVWNTGRCFRIKRHKQKQTVREKGVERYTAAASRDGMGPRWGSVICEKAKISGRKIETESQGRQDLSHSDGHTEAEIYRSQEALSTAQQESRRAVRDAQSTHYTLYCVGSERHSRAEARHALTLQNRFHTCPFLLLTVS